MSNRIEILRGTEWTELYLGDSKAIKYNTLINRVGSMSQREISHSNTFSLPYVYQNIQALGINVFNAGAMARAFNAKYVAKYYVKNRLSQEGFLVINNTDSGSINVNFIDGALSIVESWGSMTYYDLLSSETLNIPEPYKSSLLIMKNYNMSKNIVLSPLLNMTGKDYPIAKFPNNLNAIGDKFQKPSVGNRLSDTFNPYQSRPIFNVKALFDIAIETFGYTPFYDDSIDWNKLQQTYLIEKGLSQSEKSNTGSSVVKQYPSVDSVTTYGRPLFTQGASLNFIYPNEVTALYPNQVAPNIIRWINEIIETEFGLLFQTIKDWRNLDRCLLIPNTNNLTTGTMQFSYDTINKPILFLNGSTPVEVGVASWFKDLRVGYETRPCSRSLLGTAIVTKTDFGWNVLTTVPKSEIGIKPYGANLGEAPDGMVGDFIGITFSPLVEIAGSQFNNIAIRNMIYTETSPENTTVVFDKDDQYDSQTIDLSHAAPRNITVKELLSSVMQKEGILMCFNNRQKTIKMFSYGSYITRRDEGNYSDWSEYFQEYTPALYNTDYGNEYAVINEVGLSSPYKGNTYKLILANQISGSKYKPFVQNLNSKLKDIEALSLIQNTNTPYYEYTNKGLGLVEIGAVGLGTLTQVTADTISQGTFTGLCPVYNVNYADLPDGIIAWYNLIDQSVRCQGTFLLPLNVVKNLELGEPIYVGKLGGFYIIEEVEEYIDAQTPVKVKLIKLPVLDKVIPIPKRPHYSKLHYSPLHYST